MANETRKRKPAIRGGDEGSKQAQQDRDPGHGGKQPEDSIDNLSMEDVGRQTTSIVEAMPRKKGQKLPKAPEN
ncbi:hypothetical protein [Sinorhizobium meliloti]|uniref:hypothetical protein n=1 Tax=Rhizobium meliloti TaxID=382 RepID=UPI000FD6E2D9|nr:hypothetical protein [Sinorhizobium meliloti]RVH14163.1 hypothetical protein CN216_20395 [Sinorhizobium meliloti]RVH53215.1 hypothetical protein CN212_03370 [Sinorhizobium meliloti]